MKHGKTVYVGEKQPSGFERQPAYSWTSLEGFDP